MDNIQNMKVPREIKFRGKSKVTKIEEILSKERGE